MRSSLAERIQGMPDLHFALLVLVGGAILLYLFLSIWRNLIRARLVEDIPTSRVRSAPQGYVELQGVASPAPGSTLVSPLSGDACVWYRFRVEEERDDMTSRGTRWSAVDGGVSEQPFLFSDGTGTCLVDPRGAEVLPGRRRVWYGDRLRPGKAPKKTGFLFVSGGRYRYTEDLLDAGDVYLLGWFETRGSTGPDLDEEVAALLRAWKVDQNDLKRRFDADRDGRLDADEWERARIAARGQVLRARAERLVEPAVQWLRKPGDDSQPYLISGRAQRLVSGRYRRLAGAALAGSLAATAVLTWVLSARFA